MIKLAAAMLGGMVVLVIAVTVSVIATWKPASTSTTSTSFTDPPPASVAIYEAAAAQWCPGMPWQLLAAINWQETRYATQTTECSSAGACGPMQFIPATWAEYGDGGDIDSLSDAAPAAARLLCANGAATANGIPGSIFAYNHDQGYVASVTGNMATLLTEQTTVTGTVTDTVTATASP